nr:phosphotransferase family protein [Pseudomaricurvus alkylphenolicus]
MPDAKNIEVTLTGQIFGGASRQTYRLKVSWSANGVEQQRGMILRREAESGLIDTEGETEFRAFEAIHGKGIPVPEALYLENDSHWLGRPFIVTSEITKSRASNPMTDDPYGVVREKVGEQFFDYLGKLATFDPEELGLTRILEPVTPERCWEVELKKWETVINQFPTPEPIAQTAIRWLRANPPRPPEQVRVVHGDFRTGNVMATKEGEITAVLDWEMAHIGDPLEDLAWAIDPMWGYKQPNRVGGMIPRNEALRIYQSRSGVAIDHTDLAWWEMFSHVKGLAIWGSAAKEFQLGNNNDPIMLVAGLAPFTTHEHILAKKLLTQREARGAH